MDEIGGIFFGIVIVIAAIVFIFKLVVSAIAIAIGIVIVLIPPALVIYGVYSAFRYGYAYFDNFQKAIIILSSTTIFGISTGSLLTKNWMIHTSIPNSIIIVCAILSGGTLATIVSYPYIKYLSAVSNYRKKEQHLIKP
jgi:hypothetical protein